MDESQVLSTLFERQAEGLLRDWLHEQLAESGSRKGSIREGELKEQCREFLALLKDATSSGRLGDVRGPQWAKVRAIFLDLIMPEMSGFEVLEELRHRPETRDIPVIVHTTSTVGEPERQRLASATAILNKDAPRELVRQALAKAGIGGRSEVRH